MRGFVNLAKSCGWFIPYEKIAILSERPIRYSLNERGELNNEEKKAIEWSDGSGIYVLEGIVLEDWIMEHPEKITVKKIRGEGNLEIRRLMMNKMGISKYLDECNLVLMYLVPGTYSPISLLELGQLSKHHKKEGGEDKHTVVVCPRSFWRRGNVEVVCSLFHLPLYETLEEGIAHIKTLIQIN